MNADFDAWIAAFAERHDIDLAAVAAGAVADPDPQQMAESKSRALAYTVEHTPVRYHGAILDQPDIEAWAAKLIRDGVEESQRQRRATTGIYHGTSLLLLGPTGVGKTYAVYGALAAITGCGVRVAWQTITAADLYARLRPRHAVDSEAEFRRVADAPLLVVDDLGAAKDSEWTEEINYRLVNHRYEHFKPTIFTSNLTPKTLATELGERVTSRLTEMTTRIALTGSDRRRAA